LHAPLRAFTADRGKGRRNISDTIIEVEKDNNSHTYLNEKENWRGKNKSPKNRSKYLTICPDVESIHAKPKFTRTIPLLKNGSILGPVILDKKPILVINTCPFDAIAQTLLLVAYYDWENFHDYLEQTENDIFRFIKELSICGPSVKIFSNNSVL